MIFDVEINENHGHLQWPIGYGYLRLGYGKFGSY